MSSSLGRNRLRARAGVPSALFLILGAVLGIQPAARADGALPRVDGRIVNDLGAPQSGATVALYGATGGHVVTGDDATFDFQVDSASQYATMSISTARRLEAPGYLTQQASIPVSADLHLGDVVLPTLEDWTVSVVDAAGDPASGASVSGGFLLSPRPFSTGWTQHAAPYYNTDATTAWDGKAAVGLPTDFRSRTGVKVRVASADGTVYQYDLANGAVSAATRTVRVTATGVNFPPRATFTAPHDVVARAVAGDGHWRPTFAVEWSAARHSRSPILGYTVQTSTGAAEEADTSGRTTLSQSEFRVGEDYRFRVRAHNAEGSSPWSEWSDAVTASDVPAAPTTAPRVTSVRNRVATIEWDRVDEDGGLYPVTHYRITDYYGDCPCALVPVTDTAAQLPFEPGDPLQYRYAAVSDVGRSTLSPPSDYFTGYAPPLRPVNVRATAADRRVDVSWTPADTTFSWYVSNPETYTVAVEPGGHRLTVPAPQTEVSFVDLPAGQTYSVTVSASSRFGDSPDTSPLSVTLAAQVPDTPARPTVELAGRDATVRWDRPEANGSPIASYEVTALPSGLSKTVAGTQATFTNLARGEQHTFTVVARNGIGASAPSAPSDPVTVAAIAPDAPPKPTVELAGRDATVRWATPNANGSAITSYTVTASPGGVTRTVRTTEAVFAGLATGERHTFTVVATNAVGTSASSLPSDPVSPRITPDQVQTPTVVGGDGAATVHWTAPSDNGLPILSYTVTSFPGGRSVTVPAPATSASVTGLANGTAYEFTVIANNSETSSIPSPRSDAVVPAGTPRRMKPLRAELKGRSVLLRWAAARANGAAITHFVVKRVPGPTRQVAPDRRKMTLRAMKPGSYRFAIAAVNSEGRGRFSKPLVVRVR